MSASGCESSLAGPDLTLIGYFLKRTTLPSGWDFPQSVAEICSVSDCINPAPDDWIERWLHNELGFFDSRDDARSMNVDPSKAWRLFAFRLLPVRFVQGCREPLDIPALMVEPMSNDFVSLGFDVVSKSISAFFECSPLSCNGLASEVPVNRYCLLDTLAEAETVADRCSRDEPEPGPYYVLEALREEGQ